MDKVLERIATALETIAAALSGNNPAPADAPAKPKAARAKKEAAPEIIEAAPAEVTEAPTPVKVVSLAEIGEKVRSLVAADPANGHKNAVGVLQHFGAKRISELKAEDFPAVIAKIEALLKAK